MLLDSSLYDLILMQMFDYLLWHRFSWLTNIKCTFMVEIICCALMISVKLDCLLQVQWCSITDYAFHIMQKESTLKDRQILNSFKPADYIYTVVLSWVNCKSDL